MIRNDGALKAEDAARNAESAKTSVAAIGTIGGHGCQGPRPRRRGRFVIFDNRVAACSLLPGCASGIPE